MKLTQNTNIMTYASSIRKKGEDWQKCIDRAKKEMVELVRKKTTKRKQSGTSNIAYDKRKQALPAGRRVSKTTGKLYTEVRANRSDRGVLLGVNWTTASKKKAREMLFEVAKQYENISKGEKIIYLTDTAHLTGKALNYSVSISSVLKKL